jgi:hypothetical protein
MRQPVRRLRRPRALLLGLALVAVVLASVSAACGGGTPARSEPVEPLLGKRFPSVVGDALTKERVRLPEDFAGAPLIVLIAPTLDAQEDADRFMVSLRTRDVDFVEIPVLPSLVTRLMQRYRNGQLKESEPRDMWGRIVPLYKDGAVLEGFLGEVEDEALAIVLVLDDDGVIRFHDDRGYSRETLDAALAAYERQRT